jgi:hypothetical protein
MFLIEFVPFGSVASTGANKIRVPNVFETGFGALMTALVSAKISVYTDISEAPTYYLFEDKFRHLEMTTAFVPLLLH